MAGIKDLKPKKGGQFLQGYYQVIHPEKYRTNKNQIIFRSSWEKKLCAWLDLNTSVVEWASEPMAIKYLYVDGKFHTYYPDFYFAYRKDDGTITKYIVEVKPTSQLKRPSEPKRKTPNTVKNFNYLMEAYVKNMCKRKYAMKWCEENGYKFVYVTELSDLKSLNSSISNQSML